LLRMVIPSSPSAFVWVLSGLEAGFGYLVMLFRTCTDLQASIRF
jgi:hypothetical protein